MTSNTMHRVRRIALLVAALGTATLMSQPGWAQLSTATVKGRITAGGSAASATQVQAINKATGFVYRATTAGDGSYVITGLAPGSYEIGIPGSAQRTEVITVNVGETASLDLALPTAGDAAQKIVIIGSVQRADVRTPEVATTVTTEQIENLPQVTRNFLAFADLAPGVNFSLGAGDGMVKVQSGAQNQDNINVFIDGVSQKNYILRGGMSGMDATRGNPFPQSAIAEYKVITQNYKAEFDQVSSAAISAVTKSGTNEFHGEAFWDRTEADWADKTPFEEKAESQGVPRPNAIQNQYGFTVGGPIKQDVAHFFVAYERKEIEEPRQVVAQRTDVIQNVLTQGIVPSLIARQGATTSKFNEDLFLGKIDAQIAPGQRVDFSIRARREDDLIPEDKKLSVPGNEKNRYNEETRVEFRHEWERGDWLFDSRLTWENYLYNPHSQANEPFIKYIVSPTNNKDNAFDFLFVGGSPDNQRREQTAWMLQQDVTYTGLAAHTIKGGVKFKAATFDLSGTSRSVDVLRSLIDNTTGLATVVQTDAALAPVGVSFDDKQFGLYIQDDWQVNRNLELNLGIRWDYEDNMLNDNYVTPADRVAIFSAQDPRDGAPVGQTYGQSLAKGGININDYISTGSSRKAFKNAFQPRLGFSYDLSGNKATVAFGGLGRAYDRTMANHALDELQKNRQPGGEIWMIKNDHDVPYTDQFNIGLRQALGMWNGEVGFMYSHSHNQFNWFGGNRDVNGGWGTQSPIDPLWGSVPGYGTLILGDFVSQAKTQSVYLKLDKPYTKMSGWGVSAVYTYSDGETTNKEWTNDIFNWTYGRSTSGWNPSRDVERHKLVVAGLTDGLLPWGLMVSGKMTLGSGYPRRITDCSKGWSTCVSVEGDSDAFQQVDLGISKDVKLPMGKMVFRADVINVFNKVNYGGWDDWGGGPGNPVNYLGGDNANLGVANGMRGPMRTFKLGLRYTF